VGLGNGPHVDMRRVLRALCLAALLFADIWTAVTIANAVSSGEGEGGVFWSAIALLTLILAGLTYLTIRTAARLGRVR
jgi:hypothetical protein